MYEENGCMKSRVIPMLSIYFLSLAFPKSTLILVYVLAATNMKWIKAKMRELGVETNPNYKVAFYMDSLAMITVHTRQHGVVEVCTLYLSFISFCLWYSYASHI